MKIIKKILPITLTLLTLLSTLYVDASYKAPFEVSSEAVLLVNTDTDTVIFEKNADKLMYPASLTKIMTTILAIEMIDDLEGTVIKAQPYLFDEFYGLGVSTADIRPNEETRAIDLLYAIMLQSACEGSSIIADYLGDGNITEFVEMMNAKAKEIGATSTVFKNAHGLFHKEQVSTARDLYLITKYAMENPLFAQISNTKTYEMPATNIHATPYYVTHTNSMMSKDRGGDLYYYPHVKGIKTGTLPESGRNLISAASLEGYNYLLVTMGAPEKNAAGEKLPNGAFLDAKQLYNWAFSFFAQQTVMNQGDVLAESKVSLSNQDYVTLVAKDDVYALLPRGADRSTIQQIKTFEKDLVAPIKKGETLGKVELKLNDTIISTVDLVAYENIERSTILYSLDVTKRFFGQAMIKVLLVILVLLIFTFIALNARYKKYKRQRNARMRMMNRG